jgi:hypothetical protein
MMQQLRVIAKKLNQMHWMSVEAGRVELLHVLAIGVLGKELA